MKDQLQFITAKEAFKAVDLSALKTMTPSVFTNVAAQRTSEAYTHIMTNHVLEDLLSLGWIINRATEIRAKKLENIGYQKHIIHLRNPKLYIGNGDEEIEMLPELVLTNSHDGRSSFKFYTGLYRVICGNGLIVSTYKFNSIEIPHRGYSFNELKDVVKKMTESVPLIVNKVEALKARTLTKSEKNKIATDALRSRWNHFYNAHASELIQPLRDEDKGDNLWLLYNILQEKMISGGWVGAGGRKIKQIVDQNRELNINRKLFEIIESYL